MTPDADKTRSDEATHDATDTAGSAASGLLERALRAAGSDAAKYLPVRFVPALTSLITTPLFTRAIDAEDYGAFYLLTAVTSLLASIAVNWLASSSIRFYWPSRKSERLDAFLATVVWTGIGSLALFAVVAGMSVALLGSSLEEAIIRLVPAGLAYFVANFYSTLLLQILRAANRAADYARLSIAVTLTTTALSVGLVWLAGLGSLGILVGAIIGNAVVIPFILVAIGREGSMRPGAISRDLLGEMLAYGMPLVPVGLAGWALILMDRFILGAMRSATEVGIYSVAYGLGDKIMQLVTMPLLLTMMPSLTEAFERRGQKLAEDMQTHFTRYFALLTFPMLAGMAAVAPTFMDLFTGPQYRAAFPVLPIVAAGSMLGSLAQIAGTGLGMHKKTTIIMQNTLAAAALNVGLNLALVPRFGYIAAAWDTLAAYGALLAFTWLRSRPYMVWHVPFGALVRIGGSAAAMAGLVWAVSRALPSSAWALAIEIVLGIGTYTVLAIVLGAVRPEERRFIGELAAKGARRLRRG